MSLKCLKIAFNQFLDSKIWNFKNVLRHVLNIYNVVKPTLKHSFDIF